MQAKAVSNVKLQPIRMFFPSGATIQQKCSSKSLTQDEEDI